MESSPDSDFSFVRKTEEKKVIVSSPFVVEAVWEINGEQKTLVYEFLTEVTMDLIEYDPMPEINLVSLEVKHRSDCNMASLYEWVNG